MNNIKAKTYKKVVVSNHVIEVYEYQHMPSVKDLDSDKDDFNPLDLENVTLEEKEDLTEKRRKQTMRDSRNLIRRLALMNFNSGDKFITLTFDPKRFTEEQLRDISFVDLEFKNFIKRFNYRFNCKLKYLTVREFHRSGRIHLHMICDWDKELIFENEIREFERILGQDVWKNGFVDIKAIDHVDNVGAYITKYMTKMDDDTALWAFKGRKIYLCSKGLDRPLIYRDYEAEQIISTYGLDIKKEVFTNSYESEYLGTITYKEFNLKRL